MIGPVLPAHVAEIIAEKQKQEDEEDEIGFGPLPSNREVTAAELAAAEIEGRAKRMKNKLLGQESDDAGEPRRDTWMLDLPPELVPNFGVTARTFRTKAPPKCEDRSGWTDTPADRARKDEEALEGKPVRKPPVDLIDYAQVMKDKAYAEQVEEYNKSARAKSLLELHAEKLCPIKKKKKSKGKEKKKSKHSDKDREKHKNRSKNGSGHKKKKDKKERETVVERRPFDRDLDLQANRLDAAKRKSLINKSQQLGGRFGHGSTQFL
jgi:hypothetical protein